MAESRRKFDQDCKEGAVRLVRDRASDRADSEGPGINPGTLANWVALDRQAKDGNGRLGEDERIELARLRRENAELAMERDVLKRSVALWAKDAMGRRVAVAGFIAAQRAQYGIPHAVACRVLGVSQVWFYKWRHGDGSPRRARRRALAMLIGALFVRHRGTYGSPRMTARISGRWAGGSVRTPSRR
jgi:transposase